jgi:Fe-S oxidoreductase/electron transfer flavoprotein alpha/beta subunit/MFS family permease
MASHEIFWGQSEIGRLLFYAIAILAVTVFLAGFVRHVVKYMRGRRVAAMGNLAGGIMRMIGDVASHRTLRRRDRYAGFAHALFFVGFLIAFLATSIITLEHDIVEPLTGFRFWKGTFYNIFGLVADFGGLAMIAGIVLMALRRMYLRPSKLDYQRSYRNEEEPRPAAQNWKREDWLFLGALLLVAVTGFLQEALRLAHEQPAWAWWSPIGNSLARLLTAAGLSAEDAGVLRKQHWWFHGAIALAFIGAIPWYKAKHIIAAMGSLATRDPMALRRLPRVAEDAASTGISTIRDFTWKDILNLDACTKCGRCHEACPARMSGYPLSPRDFILDLRLHNDERQGCPSTELRLLGDIVDEETVWSCRTCGACQEICPVGIEHPPMIVQLRRALVDQGKIDPRLQNTLKTIGDTGNSFGESPRRRGDWTNDLGFQVKDARASRTQTLWYVGDFASFDPRNQQVSRTMARLLKAAKVDFGILYEGEKTAGNDVRRIGEEGLFEALVEENMASIAAAGCEEIITTDPHTFNTLKNEYPAFGAIPPVRHYSAVLRDLLASGSLKVVKPLGHKVTLHDPCHLGRLNREFEAPRDVLRLIGCELIEMPRCRENSLCCGAGGGRIWVPDPPGTTKTSESRMHEAAALGVDLFVTCCPKDLTMYEDARKTSGHEKSFTVADLAELVAEAVDLDRLQLTDMPSIVDMLSSVIADQVADKLAERLTNSIGAELARRLPLPSQSSLAQLQVPVGRRESETVDASDGRSVDVPPASVEWTASPVEALDVTDYERPQKDRFRVVVAVKHIGRLQDGFELSDKATTVDQRHFDFQMNESDEYAVEMALQLAEAEQGEVVAVTVGPDASDETLRKVLAKGVDRAVRVWSDGLIEMDPLVVARVISGVAKAECPDIVLTGVQAGDLTNAATAGFVADMLRWPVSAVVVGCEPTGQGMVSITRELVGGLREVVEMSLPAVLSVQTGANSPRYATMRMIKEARKKPIAAVEPVSDVNGRTSRTIEELKLPPMKRAAMLEGNAEQVAAEVAKLIRQAMGDSK